MKTLPRSARVILPGVIAALIAVWSLAPGLPGGLVPVWPGAEFTDLTTAHLPTAIYIHQAWAEYGQLPLWNPTILSGMPVLADPLSSVFYPPHWPLILWPTIPVASALAVLHLVFGALGVAAYLRRRQASTAAAAGAAAAFAGMPKLVGHFALGHLTLVYAVSWTPWLIYCCDNALDPERNDAANARWATAVAAVWAAMALADIRWALIGGLLGLAILVYRISEQRERRWLALGRAALLGGVTAVLLPAVQILPTWYWQKTSIRAELAVAERLELSLPAGQIAGALFPPWGIWPEWIVYAGVIVLLLAVIALISRSRGAAFWGSIILVSVLLALGDELPIVGRLIYSLPGLSALRVPPRSLFAAGTGLAILVGLGLDSLTDSAAFSAAARRRLSAIVLAVGLTAGALMIVPATRSTLSEGMKSGLLLLALVYICGGALLLAGPTATLAGRSWLPWPFVLLIVFELGTFNRSLIEARPALEPQPFLTALEREMDETRFRVFSPSLSIPPQLAASAGLELADGVHPMIYKPYWSYMAEATGYQTAGYSVTLPPLPSGDPRKPWGVEPDSVLLGELNVRYIVSAYELEAQGWRPLSGPHVGDLFVYRNEDWRPRAWVESGDQSDVEVTWSPGGIVVRARGPGTLKVSEVAAPGWIVRRDGAHVSTVFDESPLIAVELGPGIHEVELRYEMPGARVGLLATLLGTILLAWIWRRA